MDEMQKQAEQQAIECCKEMDMYSNYYGMFGECATTILPNIPVNSLHAKLYVTPESCKALQHMYPENDFPNGGIKDLMEYAKLAMPEIENQPLSYEEIAKIAEQYRKGAMDTYTEAIKGFEEYGEWVTACASCGVTKEGDIARVIGMSQYVPKPQLNFGDKNLENVIWVSEIMRKLEWLKSYEIDLGCVRVYLPSGIIDYCVDNNIPREQFNEGVFLDKKLVSCDSLFEGCTSFDHSITLYENVKSYKNMLKGCKSFNSAIHMELSFPDPTLLADDALNPSEIRLGNDVFLTAKMVKGICDKFNLAPNKSCRCFTHYETVDDCITACGTIPDGWREMLTKKYNECGRIGYIPFYYMDAQINYSIDGQIVPWSLAMLDFRLVMEEYKYAFLNTQIDVFEHIKNYTDLWESATFTYQEQGAMKSFFQSKLEHSLRVGLVKAVASRCKSTATQYYPSFKVPMGQYTIEDLEVDASMLMKIMSVDPDYRAWFTTNFPNGAPSREAVLERIG